MNSTQPYWPRRHNHETRSYVSLTLVSGNLWHHFARSNTCLQRKEKDSGYQNIKNSSNMWRMKLYCHIEHTKTIQYREGAHVRGGAVSHPTYTDCQPARAAGASEWGATPPYPTRSCARVYLALRHGSSPRMIKTELNIENTPPGWSETEVVWRHDVRVPPSFRTLFQLPSPNYKLNS